jgi:hypothetical protein
MWKYWKQGKPRLKAPCQDDGHDHDFSQGCKYPRQGKAPSNRWGRCINCGWTYLEMLDHALKDLQELTRMNRISRGQEA